MKGIVYLIAIAGIWSGAVQGQSPKDMYLWQEQKKFEENEQWRAIVKSYCDNAQYASSNGFKKESSPNSIEGLMWITDGTVYALKAPGKYICHTTSKNPHHRFHEIQESAPLSGSDGGRTWEYLKEGKELVLYVWHKKSGITTRGVVAYEREYYYPNHKHQRKDDVGHINSSRSASAREPFP